MSGLVIERLSVGIAVAISIIVCSLAAASGKKENHVNADSNETIVVRYSRFVLILLIVLLGGTTLVLAIMFVVSLFDTGTTFWIPYLFFLLAWGIPSALAYRYVSTMCIIIAGDTINVIQRYGFKKYTISFSKVGSWNFTVLNGGNPPSVRVKSIQGKILFTVRYSMTNYDTVVELLQKRYPEKEKKLFKL